VGTKNGQTKKVTNKYRKKFKTENASRQIDDGDS